MLNSIIGLMAKFPEQGKVKTRLACAVGDEIALRVYRALLENAVTRLNEPGNIQYRLGCFITPADRLTEFEVLFPGQAFYESQQGNNLGERMLSAISSMLNQHKTRKAILVGADIPDINRTIIEDAIEALDRTDVVWGPTDDGGYYLIGMTRPLPVLFEGIDWGTPCVFGRSLGAASQHNLSYTLLETLCDLDTAEDLERFPRFSHLISGRK